MSINRPLTITAFRIGIFLGDAVFVVQLAGFLSIMVWWLGGKPDWVGFTIIAGTVAGLIAYFSFILFALLSLWRQPFVFWRTLHPLNLGLAMLIVVANNVIFKKQIAVVVLLIVSWLASLVLRRWLPCHPRVWIILCFALLALRWAIPREYIGAWSSCIAGLVLSVWWWRCGSRWSFFKKLSGSYSLEKHCRQTH